VLQYDAVTKSGGIPIKQISKTSDSNSPSSIALSTLEHQFEMGLTNTGGLATAS